RPRRHLPRGEHARGDRQRAAAAGVPGEGLNSTRRRRYPAAMRGVSRRQVLEAALAAGVAGTARFAAAPASEPQKQNLPPEAHLPKVRELRDQVRRLVRGWVDAGRLVRPDGFVYAVDVA